MKNPTLRNDGHELMTRREAIRRTALAMGVALAPALLEGVLQAQTAPRGGAAPAHLTSAQFAGVRAIVERIIPRTDTPGAIEVGVPEFIDLMYGKYLTPDEQRVFAAGLADVEKRAVAQGARSFGQLAAAQQDSVLTAIARESQAKEKTFFHTIKELTLLGYFTSENVGKNVLHYDPVPGRYQGCIPLSEVGNASWTR